MKRSSLGVLAIMAIGLLVVAGCSNAPSGGSTVDVGSTANAGPVKEISIDAYNWGFTESPINIKKGDRVRLRLTSSSGTHGIAIPGLGVATGAVSPGQEEVVEFVVGESGTFDYFCNVPCGQGHREMVGQIIVE